MLPVATWEGANRIHVNENTGEWQKSLTKCLELGYATNMRSGPVLTELAAEAAEATTPAGRLLRLTVLRQAVDAAMVAALGELEAAPGPVLLDGAWTPVTGWLAGRSELHPGEARASLVAGMAGRSRARPANALASPGWSSLRPASQ